MKKLTLAIALLASSVSPAFAAWEEGDTAYVFAHNAGKTTWFSSSPLVFYAKISVERVMNKKVKGYITKMCWRTTSNEVLCDNDSQGGYRVGDYAWFYHLRRKTPSFRAVM